MNLQPLRIEAGWLVKYNQLYEVNPIVVLKIILMVLVS